MADIIDISKNFKPNGDTQKSIDISQSFVPSEEFAKEIKAAQSTPSSADLLAMPFGRTSMEDFLRNGAKPGNDNFNNLLNPMSSTYNPKLANAIVEAQKTAPDVNKDGEVNVKDYVRAKKEDPEGMRLKYLFSLSSEELEKKLKPADTSELENERQRLKNKLNYYNHGDKSKFKNAQAANEARKRIAEIGEQIKKAQNDSKIAFTSSDGQNITWQELYEDKKYEEKFNLLYNKYSVNSDWEEKSRFVSDAKENPKNLEDFGSDLILEYINADAARQEEITLARYGKAKASPGGSYNDKSFYDWGEEGYDSLNDEEKKLANYLYKKDENEFWKYLSSIKNKLLSRHRESELQTAYETAKKYPLGGSLLSVGYNLYSGAEQLANTVKFATTGELDINQSADIATSLRKGVSDTVDWNIGEWDAFDFLYNTGMSLADSVVSTASLGKFGGVALGLSAAAQSTNDALNRGMSKGYAFTSGLAAGVFETIFETWQIGAFTDLTNNLKRGDFKNLVRYIGKNMWNNAKEETLTEFANIFYDALINGEFSQYETDVRQLMAEGMSESKAKRQVALKLGGQIAQAAASGALMGFGYGTLGAVGSAQGKDSKRSSEYENASANGDILNLIQKVKSGNFKANDKVYFENITDETAKTIQNLTGIDVTGFKVAIEARQIEHILKDHGATGKTDQSMSDDSDIAKIEYILNSPDSIINAGITKAYVSTVNGKNKPAKTVLYEKQMGEQSYYAVQAVPDTKAKTLYIVSAFIGNSGYKKETSQTTDTNSPGATPKSENANASSDINISQNNIGVNNNIPVTAPYNSQNSELQSTANGGIITKEKHSIPKTGDDVDVGQQIYNRSERQGRESGNSASGSGALQADDGRVYENGESVGLIRSNSQIVRDSFNRRITPEQKESLKTSVVKNDDGTPKAVYHFTENMFFKIFAKGDIGFHFGNILQAQRHGKGKNGRIITVNLDIKNPIRYRSDLMFWSPNNIAFALQIEGILSEEERKIVEDISENEIIKNKDDIYSSKAATELRRILSEKGYDGIVYENMFEGEGESYIAFYPEQVIIIDDGLNNTNQATPDGAASFLPENGSQGETAAAEDGLSDNFATFGGIDTLKGKHLDKAQQDEIRSVGEKLGRTVIYEDFYELDKFKGKKRIPDGYIDKDGNIHINFYAKRPIYFIFKHEITHYLKRALPAYNDFMNMVFDSKAFSVWLHNKGFSSIDELKAEITDTYNEVKGFDETRCYDEILADFVGSRLFGGERAINAEFANALNPKQKKTFFDVIKDIIEYFKSKFSNEAKINLEISRIEKEFIKVYNEAVKVKTEDGTDVEGEQYSIINLDTGKSYVKASRNVIKGDNLAEWRKQISTFFNKSLKNGPIEIKTAEGDTLTITKETAEKARDRNVTENGVTRRLTDNEFLVKLHAESHIDELAEISIAQTSGQNNKKIATDTKNHSFAKDGFTYRTVYFQDFDNQYYRISLSIGENNGISTVYNVGKIKADNIPNGNIVSAIGSKADMSSADNRVTQKSTIVNNNSTQETDDYSIPPYTDAENLLDRYENGEQSGFEGEVSTDILLDRKSQETATSGNRRLTPDDLNDYMNVGKTLHTRNKKIRMLEAGKNPILTSAFEISEFILNVIHGKAMGEVRAYGIIGERLAKAIQGKRKSLELEGKYLELNADDLREAYKRHLNPKEKGDIPLTDGDFINIPEYLDNFDEVLSVNEYNGKVEIHFAKETNDGYVRILTVSSNERESLQVTKIIGVSKEKFEAKYGNKKERATGSLRGFTENSENSNPSTTAQLTAGTLSNNSISEKKSTVNNNFTQETDDYSIPPYTDAENLLDRYENGEITRGEYLSLLKKEKILNPIEIANLTEKDANTTPPLERRKGENKGDKESKFYGSLLESDIFDKRFKDEVKTDTFIERYKSVSNKDTLKQAAKELDEGGRSYVAGWWAKDVQHANLIDTAVGFILMDRYQRVGDYETAIAAAEKVREFGTASGQQVQIFSIIGRLDPNSMAVYAQKELSKAFDLLSKGRTKKWINQNAERFNLTEEDIEFIRRRTLQAAQLPEGRDKAIRLAEICTLLQDKLPPSKGEGIKAWQRMSMLLNVKTNIRNITGNAIMVPVFITSDFFGAAIDRAVSKKTNVRTTGMFDVKSVKGFAKGAFETMDDFRRHINTRNEELNRFDVGRGKAFNEHHSGKLAKQLNDCAKVLNALDRFTSFCLELGDRPFFEVWYLNSLNNQMKLNKVQEATPEMIAIASVEALQRTWQDKNKVVQAVASAKSTLNGFNFGGYGLGDVLIKFTKTPANLTKAIVDFSPAGFIKTLAADGKALKNAIETGQFEASMQKKFVDNLSKGIAGTLLYVLAIVLAKSGRLSGSGDDDKDVSNFEKYIQGMPEYSIKLFGKWWSYEWMQPLGAVAATVSDYMKSKNENPDNGAYENIIQAIRAGGEVLYNQSFMTSIQTLFTADNIIDGLIEGVLSDPSVYVPQLISQAASATDDYRRITYESNEPLKTAINKVKLKIPGLRQTLEKQVDIFGRDVPNSQGNFYNAFINPANTFTDTSTPVTDELYRLYKQTGDKTVMPRVAPNYFSVKGNRITFSAEEKADFQRDIGKVSADLLAELFENKEYKKLSDEQKVEATTKIYDFATAKAKSEWDFDYNLLSAMSGEKKNGAPILTKDMYKRLNQKARQHIAEEYFLSKSEMRYSDDAEKLIEYYIGQVEK